ncbi:hypothetical protein LINGRAHAP2_LOCUS7216, partial [Linum grandiflorum]
MKTFDASSTMTPCTTRLSPLTWLHNSSTTPPATVIR